MTQSKPTKWSGCGDATSHGTGKEVKVLALVTADKESEAKEAGADFVGLDDFIEKIKVDGPT